LALILTGRWDFQLDKDWIFFFTLGVGYNSVSKVDDDAVTGGGFKPMGGVGAMYNVNSELAIRLDFSYQFFGLGALYRF
jgi:hypothetical protein